MSSQHFTDHSGRNRSSIARFDQYKAKCFHLQKGQVLKRVLKGLFEKSILWVDAKIT